MQGFNEKLFTERERWLLDFERNKLEETVNPDLIIQGNEATMQATAQGYNQLLQQYGKNFSKKVEDLKQKNAKKNEELTQLEKDVHLFMKGIMDECTHIKNFPMPVDTELCNIVQAQNDAYYPVEGVMTLEDIWKGCQVRTVPRGHISGFVFERKLFRYRIQYWF